MLFSPSLNLIFWATKPLHALSLSTTPLNAIYLLALENRIRFMLWKHCSLLLVNLTLLPLHFFIWDFNFNNKNGRRGLQAITGLQDHCLCTEILAALDWNLEHAISSFTTTTTATTATNQFLNQNRLFIHHLLDSLGS
jgi:hypothetical protein